METYYFFIVVAVYLIYYVMGKDFIPTVKVKDLVNVPQEVVIEDFVKDGHISYHIYYIKSGSNLTLTCNHTSEEGADDTRWTFESGNPVHDLGFDGSHLMVKIDKLIFIGISPSTSGNYFCRGGSGVMIGYKVRVYTLAQIGVNISFSFLTRNCSSSALKNALSIIKSWFCNSEISIKICPYQFNIDCDIKNVEAFLSVKNNERVVMARLIAMKFTRVPRKDGCDVRCNIIEKNEQLSDDLPDLEKLQTSLADKFKTMEGRYLRKHDVIKNLEPVFVCKSGHVVWSEMGCVPCEVGHYSPVYSFNQRCFPCPLNTYQSRIGENHCSKCSSTSITLNTGSNSSRDCLEKAYLDQALFTNISLRGLQTGEYNMYRKQFLVLALLTGLASIASCSMWSVLIGQFIFEVFWQLKRGWKSS